MGTTGNVSHREPWNKGKIVGQKAPFELKDLCRTPTIYPRERRPHPRQLPSPVDALERVDRSNGCKRHVAACPRSQWSFCSRR